MRGPPLQATGTTLPAARLAQVAAAPALEALDALAPLAEPSTLAGRGLRQVSAAAPGVERCRAAGACAPTRTLGWAGPCDQCRPSRLSPAAPISHHQAEVEISAPVPASEVQVEVEPSEEQPSGRRLSMAEVRGRCPDEGASMRWQLRAGQPPCIHPRMYPPGCPAPPR